jgi:hypothetical protein
MSSKKHAITTNKIYMTNVSAFQTTEIVGWIILGWSLERWDGEV